MSCKRSLAADEKYICLFFFFLRLCWLCDAFFFFSEKKKMVCDTFFLFYLYADTLFFLPI